MTELTPSQKQAIIDDNNKLNAIGNKILDQRFVLKTQQIQQEALEELRQARLINKEPAISLPEAKAKNTKGFSDPDLIYPKQSLIQEQDTNRLARGESLSDTVVGEKEIGRTLDRRIAGTNDGWEQPRVSANPVYPHNDVKVSKAGIIDERDSTPGNVRIHQYHPAGTFREVDHSGTVINKIIGDNYSIIERNGYVTLKGSLHIIVEGDCTLLAQHNLTAEVYGDANVISKNDLNITSHGHTAIYSQEDLSIKAKSFSVETFGGDINMLSSANIDNKCKGNHTIDAEVNIQHRCNKDLITEAIENVNVKSGINTNIQSSALLNVSATSKINVVCASDISLNSATDINIRGTNNVNIDCNEMHVQEGIASSPVAVVVSNLPVTEPSTMVSSISLPATPEAVVIQDLTDDGSYSFTTSGEPVILPVRADKLTRQKLYEIDVPTLIPTTNRYTGKSMHYESPEDMDANFEPYMEKLKSKTMVDSSVAIPVPTPTETAIITKPIVPIVDNYTYENFTNEEDIPKGVQLSPNFSLIQFCNSSDRINKIKPQMGLTVGEIVQNLQYLAVNVVEKIRAEYPEMHIHSGYRYQKGEGKSKHYMGCAVDMGFSGRSRSEYFAIAKRITEILPVYDQVILEYTNYNGEHQWIHVAYNINNQKREVYTYFNNKNEHAYLANMA